MSTLAKIIYISLFRYKETDKVVEQVVNILRGQFIIGSGL